MGEIDRLARTGILLVPRQISWRRADQLVKRGLATLYPFHVRWLGKITITETGNAIAAGRAALAARTPDATPPGEQM